MVPPVVHVGAIEGPKQAAIHHLPVYYGGGTEETLVGGTGYVGEQGEEISGLWEAYRDGKII